MPISLTMIQGLSFILFFSIIFTHKVLQQDSMEGAFSWRRPSSERLNCYQEMKDIQVINDPKKKTHFWRKFIGLPAERFNYQKYDEFVTEYNAREGDDLFSSIEETPESLLALTRAIGNRYVPPENMPTLKLNRFKEAALEGIVKRFQAKGRLEVAQIENLTRELYMTAYGPEVKLKNFFKGSEARDEIILRVVQQDLLSRGLLRVFSDYRISKNTPSFIQKFRQTKLGKAALTGIFNLPMYAGWPPLWLPDFKPLKLTDELADEVLDKGLTDNVLRRLDMSFSSDLVTRLRYDILRSYYLKGIMVYVSLAGLYDFYQLNKGLDDESEILQNATAEVVSILDSAADLEQSGIDIFTSQGIEEGKSFCEAIHSCLGTLGTTLSESSPDQLKTCCSIMDPDNRCKNL